MNRGNARCPGRSGRRNCQGRFLAVLLCGAGTLLAGCGPRAYDPSLLRQAATLGANERWDEARPLIKAHLLKHPEDAVAHYYFGLSYLHQKFPLLTLAEGELLTAQELLARDATLPDRAVEMEYFKFKGVLHQKTALVYMRAFREALNLNVPYDQCRGLLLKAVAQVDLGLKSDPKSPHLKEYRDFLHETLQATPERMPEVITRKPGSGGPV